MRQMIFIYGTLKRGLSNHSWMDGQQFVREVETAPLYRLVDLGGFPGLVEAPDAGGLAIQGELWAVDEPGVRRLNLLESVDEREYELRPVQLSEAANVQDAKSYFYLRNVTGFPDVGPTWRE